MSCYICGNPTVMMCANCDRWICDIHAVDDSSAGLMHISCYECAKE